MLVLFSFSLDCSVMILIAQSLFRPLLHPRDPNCDLISLSRLSSSPHLPSPLHRLPPPPPLPPSSLLPSSSPPPPPPPTQRNQTKPPTQSKQILVSNVSSKTAKPTTPGANRTKQRSLKFWRGSWIKLFDFRRGRYGVFSFLLFKTRGGW